MGFARGLLLALSFLTVLAPARRVEEHEFPLALPWFPAAGLVVGLLAVLPGWLGLFPGQPFLAGWSAVLVSLWLTRGLHADGLADIADAFGSGATGERFWAILKDSRAGPFAVMALVLALSGLAWGYGALLGQGRFGVVVWSCVSGRLAGLWVLAACRRRVRPGLAALFAPGAGFKTMALSGCVGLLLGLVLAGARDALAGAALAGGAVWLLAALSRRQGGFNGDFIGAAIVLGELAAVLAALA